MYNYKTFLLALTLFSCRDTIHSEYHSFNYKAWDSDSSVIFNYTISDTTKKYDLSLNIRHDVNYEFQNLFLFLEGENTDTLELMLATKNGKWLGSGISDIRELKYPFEKGKRFFKKGEYELRVEQAMRYGSQQKIEKLHHILDVGLIISTHNE